MKRTIVIMGVFALSLLTVSVRAQQTPTTPSSPASNNGTPTTQTWEAKNNPTVDSIAAKYRDKIVATPAPLTTEQIFPVIGKYESNTNTEAPVITVSLDDQNHGIAWIDGLPQGRVKALLRKAPAVYKIPAQKTEEGKEVKEGTMIFDKDQNTISICLGKDFNAENPSAVFAAPVQDDAALATTTKTKSKSKKVAAPKPWFFTATKVEKTTALNQP